MVYTTLIEPYYYPCILPIEVTILRGARRLRLSNSLRKKYADFVPKIWHLLSRLGYQKYLQKIYVNMDTDMPVISPYYQLPIVVAILEALGMLKIKVPLFCIGKFLADYSLSYPVFTEQTELPFPQLQTTMLEEGERLEQYLNHIHTNHFPVTSWQSPLPQLFPGVTFTHQEIDLTRTPQNIIKKIPETSWLQSTFYLDLKRKPVIPALLLLLRSRPKPKGLSLEYSRCFCRKTPCICTKNERQLHTEQLYILKNLWK